MKSGGHEHEAMILEPTTLTPAMRSQEQESTGLQLHTAMSIKVEMTVHSEVAGMKVTHSDWYLAGTYCPLGRDAVLGGIVYLREHVTPQDMVQLGCAVTTYNIYIYIYIYIYL